MELTVGAVLEGKVKSITSFGAFIALPEGRTGMVHISEVANAYVSDIHQHLAEGQVVRVMVIGNENGRINLSIKRLEPRPPREVGRPEPRPGVRPAAPRTSQGHPGHQNHQSSHPAPVPNAAPKSSDQLFEEKLKAFMSESDSKISSIKQYSEHRTKSRRR